MAFTFGAPSSDVMMGYVTWSSRMSGLRSHREYTMTCVSDRSGSASSAMWFIDQTANTSATSVAATTRMRFSAENWMIRRITAASP